MVDYKKKRKAAAAVPTTPARPSNKRRKPSAAQKDAAKPKKVVEAGSLAWHDVELPEMFNDAEGFFGLEEVTGVEVVRTGNVVKFVSDAQFSCAAHRPPPTAAD